ncbi:MAG TPA: tetratricopeptide repeat protein, partial [Planctomycetota bacterium]|nr:tetratricopeptide repeat protein [Planctomycetota bacterium]
QGTQGSRLIARPAATTQGQRARLRLDFLGAMLASPSPLLDGPDVRVRDVLDRAAGAAPDELAADPVALADTLVTLGLTYYRIADHAAGEAQFRAAILLCRGQADGALDDTLSLALGGLTALLTDTGRLDEARAAVEEALAISRRLHGERSLRAAEHLSALGIVVARSGDRERAEALFREALALQTELLGPDDPATIGTMLSLAAVLDAPPRDEAEALMRAGIAALRPHVAAGREGQRLASALRNLAVLLSQTGRREEAVAALREALEVGLAACGEEHPDVAATRALLGLLLESQGDEAGAVEQLSAAVPALRRMSPASDAQLGVALVHLGTLLAGFDRMDEAEGVLREALETNRRVGGPLGEGTVQSVSVLSAVLVAVGRKAEAKTMLEELAAEARQAGPAGAMVAFRCQQVLDQLANDEGGG